MIIKKINKKILVIFIVLLAMIASCAAYAAGVVFFGGLAAQTVVSFTTVGTTSWTVPDGVTSVEVLVVAGGGGTGFDVGGGGGGGGIVYHSSKAVTPGQSYTVTVGNGGSSGQGAAVKGGNGGNSIFSDITAVGGGGGGAYPGNGTGLAGGSGGGGGDQYAAGGGATQGNSGGGTGYGYAGGSSAAAWGGAGGGGAGGPGQNGITGQVVNGGQGYISSISGSSVEYGKGGKGNYDGGVVNSTPANVGEGAMGTGSPNNSPYSGGTGIVIIKYSKSKIAADSIQKGLVGHWALDGDSYNTATGRVTDKTPLEHHGTNNGATLTTDRMGQTNGAMSFNGSNNYVQLSSNTENVLGANPSEWSYSAWFKTSGSVSAKSEIISNYDSDGGDGLVGIWTGINADGNTGRLFINVRGTGAPDYLYTSAGTRYDDGVWHNIFVTAKKGNFVKGYIDGIKFTTDGSSSLGADDYIDNASLRVGALKVNGSVSEYWPGSISDVRIYNRALSATEVTTLYGAYKPKVTTGSLQQGLVFDMPLTSNYTKTVTAGSQIMTDRTPYSNNGQNYGATVGSDSTSFNGGSYIGVPNSTVFNNQTFSISAWVQLAALAQNGFIFEKGTVNTQYSLFFEGSNLCFRTQPTAGDYHSQYSNTASLGITDTNTWYHLTATYDGSYKRVYVNGILKLEVAWSGTLNTNPGGEWIGVYGGGGYLFNGKISALRIYNRALSPQEIESLYVQGATNLGGVKTYRTSCKAILDAGESTGDGFYTIKPNSGGLSFRAYCDMTTDGGGWTLVLLNNKGLTSPTPAWDSAISDVNTIGTLNTNLTSFDLFLGVSYWKNLGSKMRLQIGSSPSSLTNKAIYSGFSFGGNYALSMSGETIVVGAGSPGMYYYPAANHFNLSTSDRDNDVIPENCSAAYGNAPWWYGGCWDGSFWGYGTAEGARWNGSAGGADQQWGSIWVGQ